MVSNFYQHVGLCATVLFFVLLSQSTAQPSNSALTISSVHISPRLCPCAISDDPKSVCYDFVNAADGTCTNRTCDSAYMCTNGERASHYCIERAQEVMRLMPEAPGRCSTRQETKQFRVPYGVFDGTELGEQGELGAKLEDDLEKFEPEACYM